MSTTTQDKGHVFVVRGRLELVHCDANIVPTDSDCYVERTWDEVLKGVARPTSIDGMTYSQRPNGEGVWFVDVTDRADVSLSALLENLTKTLKSIGAAKIKAKRARPLVAVPMLGVGGGGHRGSAGEVVKRVIDALRSNNDGFDVVLVAFEESDYAAAQWVRRQSGMGCADDSTHERQKVLAERSREGGLSLLIGAGVSQGAGLPGWNDLLSDVLARTGEKKPPNFEELSPLDQAQYAKAFSGHEFAGIVMESIRGMERPGLGHLILASLGCRAVVTTNYDTLYESAVKSQTGALEPALLPYGRVAPGGSWLLKLHGDIDHPEDVVLARDEFVSYDSRMAPAGALFQSLLLTSHLLAVGVSYTDDNILRLTHEVAEFQRSFSAETRALGTVLSLGGDPVRSKIWEGALDWLTIGDPDAGVSAQARELEIFLDHVAMHASTSSSYLLDPRYTALQGDDREAIAAVATAGAQVPPAPAAHDRWKPLRDAFRSVGYRPTRSGQ